MTNIQPTNQPARWIVRIDDEIAVDGATLPGEITTTGHDLIGAEGEADYLAALTTAAVAFDPLPDNGWLEQDRVYSYDGVLVMVRQSHYRTIYEPSETPALFVIHREGAADVLDWVSGESVLVGTQRVYGGVRYSAIQAHVTQEDWIPPNVPALWEIVEDEPPVGDVWIDSGETVTALYGAGVIGVTNTAFFSAGQSIRISGTEASVTRIHAPGAPGILVISPHIGVSGGEMIEILGS